MKRDVVGYVVMCNGCAMGQAAESGLRVHERGRLFTTRDATVFPTLKAAHRAARKSAKAWGESQKKWWVKPLVRAMET